MEKGKLIEFDAEILACNKKIKEIEPYINENEALATLYNRLIVQRAILKDNKKKKNHKKPFSDKLRRIFTLDRRKKLICDFFQESF